MGARSGHSSYRVFRAPELVLGGSAITPCSGVNLYVWILAAPGFGRVTWSKSLVWEASSLGGWEAMFPELGLSAALAFTSCLCRALKVAGGESLGPSQIFPLHLHSPGAHTHGLPDSQEYVTAFHSPLWTLHSPGLPFKAFWSDHLSLLLSAKCYPPPQAIPELNNCF